LSKDSGVDALAYADVEEANIRQFKIFECRLKLMNLLLRNRDELLVTHSISIEDNSFRGFTSDLLEFLHSFL
jgi:hypothetical protein